MTVIVVVFLIGLFMGVGFGLFIGALGRISADADRRLEGYAKEGSRG